MNKTCPNCNEELKENVVICPKCNTSIEEKKSIEEVSVDPNSVISLEDPIIVENNVSNEGTTIKEDTTPPTEEKINDSQTILEEEKHEEPIAAEETKPLEEQKNVSEIISDTNEIVDAETKVINESIETVTITGEIGELKSENQEIVVEIPEMPEQFISEIDSNILGNIYDEAERINNEKIERKHQEELARLEQEKLAMAAKSQGGPRPDLLANQINEEEMIFQKPKKKSKKGIIIFFIILIIILVSAAAYYFLVLNK